MSVAAGAAGIVIAGVGDGNLGVAALTAARAAVAAGVAVVRSSRTGGGVVARNIEIDDDALCRLLAETPNLAPGDFAAVGRRVRVLGGAPSIDDLVAELRLEAAVKEGARRAIGF